MGANVWSLIRHSPKMRELGLPLKRAVLFEGDYGTGKTLGAFLTAQKCLEASRSRGRSSTAARAATTSSRS